jgi:hypothetical protein
LKHQIVDTKQDVTVLNYIVGPDDDDDDTSRSENGEFPHHHGKFFHPTQIQHL